MKLAEALRIVQAVSAPDVEKFSVYLACGIFPLHLSTFLAAHLRERLSNRAVEVFTGLYGDLPGNLASLRDSSADAGAVAIEWSDFDPRLGLRRLGGWGPEVLADIQVNVGRSASNLLELLSQAALSKPLALSLPTLPLPPISYQPGEQSSVAVLLLEKTLADFAASAARIHGVKIINHGRLDRISPVTDRLDVKSDLSTGFPYRTAHASEVAELLAGLIQPRPAKKGLITDLDDTLWRGLLGEDGVEGISWDIDRRSHIHALYQQTLRALAESGVLIGVASKNDPDLVSEALNRQDLLLPKDCLFPIDANWNSKSEAVRRILDVWNINEDAVVFVDDSPLELAEVASLYPEIKCLRFPIDDEQAAYYLLEELRDLFGKQEILNEDTIRVSSIRKGNQFQQQLETETARPLESFLADLEAEVSLSPVAADDARAFELVNKTNQFNLNARRLSQSEFQAALDRRGAVSLLVSYKDKYGPLGKIAVVLGEIDGARLKLDTWVMSCRAFSRHIEHRCLDYLFESLQISELQLDFQATTRNRPMQEFLAKFVDGELSSPIIIPRATFMSRKPALAQRLNEGSYV
ncbi:MAG TPA: HAD family hydrolase [Blastocatellia bacterium]|nr:HAD family hydrolase [Blastocatellia bacterium]